MRSTARSSRGDVDRRRGCPSATTTRPPTTTWRTSAAVAANTAVVEGVARSRCRPCAPSRAPIVVRSASAPGSMRPASGQPRLAWPCSVAIAQQRRARRGCPRTPVARRSSSSTARASSSRSITAWESLPSVEPGAGVAQRPRRADAVGEVALGRRAEAAPAAGAHRAASMSASRDVGGVDGREPVARARRGRRAAASGVQP